MSGTATIPGTCDLVRAAPRKRLKVVIAEDDRADRMILVAMLRSQNCDVVESKNGAEAVVLYQLHQPDCVILDCEMPVMDGFESARRIKAISGARFVPIIFVTNTLSDARIAKCVEAGGDDFLSKPLRPTVLEAKMAAMVRISRLNDRIIAQNDELNRHGARVRREQEVARDLFKRLVRTGNLDAPNIKYLLAPAEVFHGDLLLAAWRPNGAQNALIGDFAGHGLPAATGTLSVAEIFYSMTERGFSILDIAREINRRLKAVMPAGLFLAACLIELDAVGGALTVLNAGVPDGMIVRPRAGAVASFRSLQPPLGILDDTALNLETETVSIKDGDRIYFFSDGLPEASNRAGEMFGMDRIAAILTAQEDPERAFEALIEAVTAFGESQAQADDQTLIELRADAAIQGKRRSPRGLGPGVRPSTHWTVELELHADAIQSTDPLPLLGRLVTDLQGFEGQKETLFLVLAELVSNAIDHGVLGLSSNLKGEPDGFEKYFTARAAALAKLKSGSVKIKLDHVTVEGGGLLTISIKDSGKGFDYSSLKAIAECSLTAPSGRGIALVASICRSVAFRGAGNEVVAEFQWQRDPEVHLP